MFRGVKTTQHKEHANMKVCISATTNSLTAQLDPRFGRCNYFLIVDPQTQQYEALPNPASEAPGGAGIQAAQLIANSGATVVITGNVGPNAFRALSAAGIEVLTAAPSAIQEVLEAYKTGNLTKIGAPTVGEHFGAQRGGP